MTLPSSIFADSYTFTANDPLFEASHNLRSLRSISGEMDLEAPDYVIDKWGQSLLLELAEPSYNESHSTKESWEVTIPLHLRYQPPQAGGFDEIEIPWPVVFWACTAEEGTKFPGNPFDRVHLGYDGLFGSRTMFYHLKPSPDTSAGAGLIEKISVPILDTTTVGGDRTVETGTLIVILLGFGWIVFKLWPALYDQLFSDAVPISTTKESKKLK